VQYGGVPAPIRSPKIGAEGWQISTSGGAFAAGEPQSASTWYPVNDTPTDKASFHLAAKVPDGWSVISNGLPGRTESRDGWTTFRWDEPDPVASYLTTVGVDRWTIANDKLADGTPVVSAFAPGTDDKKALEARLPEILDFLSSKFGKYPQDAAGGIFIADKIGFSLETQTRPIFAQWTNLSTVVHENAHQWWGDSVSVRQWKDVCLNECMASYAQWLWSEAKEGANLDAQYRLLAQKGQQVFGGKLYDMGAGSEFTAVYTKGPMALHALRRTIGDDPFFQVLKTWPAAHRDGNATWPEFESYVEKVSGKDLKGFFDAWFRGVTQPADQYLWPGSLKP
jgi:aminopeptidase N